MSRQSRLLSLLFITLLIPLFQNCSANSLGFATVINAADPFSGSSLASTNQQSVQPRVVDRNYVTSNLEAIFGNTSDVQTILTNEILSHSDVMGGRCDEKATNDCLYDLSNAYTPMLASASTLREVRKIRACDQIIQATNGANVALAQIFNGGAVVTPTAATIASAFHLFSPAQTLDPAVATYLLGLSAQVTPASDQWKFILSVLCYDPSWEMP